MAQESNLDLHGDGIADFISERWPEKVAQQKYNDTLIDMMRSWREWDFFKKITIDYRYNTIWVG